MKEKFKWYFPISEKEINTIWKTAILTLDANVLLDLYRYHESTRNALIKSLKEFQGRLWLTNQAAEEFIENRKGVISTSETTFKQAEDEVRKLKGNFESSIVQLKGNRIIPIEIANKLIENLKPAIDSALEEISAAKSSHPDYLRSDPILEQLSEMFENSIGDDFSNEEMSKLLAEAEDRKNKKIPPGYLDDQKMGNRPFGDFILWRQILLKSKKDDVPIIFVTSERKEDWWEKISGKTLGPRPELMREAFEFCSKRVLIYQTDRFLEYSSKRSGNELDTNAVDEIRAIDSLRSDLEHAVEIIDQRVIEATEFLQEGSIYLNIQRPVRNFTASGRLDPFMILNPNVSLKLISAPENLGKFKLRAGAGTNYDFNLHIISDDYEKLLPTGQYVLHYKAFCDSPTSKLETVSKLAKSIGTTSDRLLKQLNAAGINLTDIHDEVTSQDKQKLLEYLKNSVKSD